MRCPIGEADLGFIDVAPAPSLGWIVALDDGVACRLEVPRRVAIGRVVATADMAAGPAQAQMLPGRAAFEAFLAPERARLESQNARGMAASNTHQAILIV